MGDKRKTPRLEFGITVLREGKRAITKDISQSGTFVKEDEPISLDTIGSEISFSLDFPDAKNHINVTGVILHHGKNSDGMGIWFKKIDERSKTFIRKFVIDHLHTGN